MPSSLTTVLPIALVFSTRPPELVWGTGAVPTNDDAFLSLNHCERRLNLPADTTRAVPKDWNAEAAFAVDEADDPLRKSWPFLLIARTGRIFTAHTGTLRRGCDMDEYRRILGCSSKQWGFITAKLGLNRYSYGRRLPGLRFRASP